MKIKLKGLTSNIELLFVDHYSYDKLFGYVNTFCNYTKNVGDTLTYTMWSPLGFNDSLPIDIFQDKGVGEEGSVYRGTSYGEKLISWNFRPSFTVSAYNISPQKILNALVNSGELVEVTVNDVYKATYVFENNTTTEGGLISMVTANTDNGVYWSKGNVNREFYLLEGYPYIPKTLPQVLLNVDTYPLNMTIMVETETLPITTIGGEINGSWDSFELDLGDGNVLTYDNTTNADKFIVIDSINLTIQNESGEDRINDIVSTTGDKFPKLTPVLNNWIFKVNGFENLVDLGEIPTDMRVVVTYEELTSTIEEVYV